MNPLKVSRSVAEKEMSEVGSPLSVATILPSPSNLHLILGNYIQSYSLKPLKGCKFSN